MCFIGRRRSGAQQGLDGAALVHRPVALGGLVERQGQVEHLARVDDPVLDEADQVGQEPADRGGAAVQVDLGVEPLLARQLDVVGDSEVADVAAGPGRADGLHHRLLGADGLDDRVGTVPASHLLDARDGFVAALGDDVGGAVLERQLLARLVPAHRDDPRRAELPRGEHGEQANRAITDDRDRLARPDVGGRRAEPPGAEHVRGGEQAGDQVGAWHGGRSHQGPVGQRHAQVLRLRPVRADQLRVHAAALVAGQADLARVVRREERADDELARLDGPDVAADLFDDADVLVSDRVRRGDRVDAAPAPEVRAAHAGGGQADDRVRGLTDLRVFALLDAHVAWCVDDRSAHDYCPPWVVPGQLVTAPIQPVLPRTREVASYMVLSEPPVRGWEWAGYLLGCGTVQVIFGFTPR